MRHVYKISNGKESKVIEAKNQAAAVRHFLSPHTLEVKAMKPAEVVAFMRDGGEVEEAPDPEPKKKK